MSTMPVVWCSDPNSTNNKPTAFALQGIQLQGNITEQHVLALRQLINAASEGRLLLPTEGGVLLLDCGIGVGSLIVQKQDVIENNKKDEIIETAIEVLEDKKIDEILIVSQSLPPTPPPTPYKDYEILYEFLCCAKCMNDTSNSLSKCANFRHRKNSSKLIKKYLDSKIKSKLISDPVYNITNKYTKRVIKPTCITKNRSFKKTKSLLTRRSSNIPIYAIVNKKKLKTDDLNDLISFEGDPIPNVKIVIHEPSSRKTSIDSIDSGFIELQNKMDSLDLNILLNKKDSDSDGLNSIKEETNIDSNKLIITQSRNRRKSYEEFKLMFKENNPTTTTAAALTSIKDETKILQVISEKEKVKSRRKSYEEFKNLVKECDNLKESENNNNLKMKRKNSKRLSFSKRTLNNIETAPKKTDCTTIYDILHKDSLNQYKNTNDDEQVVLRKKEEEFKKNYKIYDKFLNYGTIYDIIQKKNDIYQQTFQKYDKYMTYGTIYEILHRKTENDDIFQRKRACSEKYNKRKISTVNYSSLKFSAMFTKQQEVPSKKSPIALCKYGTIYDILQNKSSSANHRFLVEKITEEDLITNKINEKSKEKSEYCLPKIQETKNPARTRRFSNILSYTPTKSSNNDCPVIRKIAASDENLNKITETKSNNLVELLDTKAIDDLLYSRINKNNKNINNSTQIFKSNSLELLSPPSSKFTSENETSKFITISKVSDKKFKKLDSNLVINNNLSGKLLNVDKKNTTQTKKRQKSNTRRLSEFTRGEFLNEKA